MPQLVLLRHGNTFQAGEIPRMVGGKTDMALTETGLKQGQAAADMITSRFAPLSGIITGPLIRTKTFAKMIADATNNVFTVDERLCEINYGLWENKTTDEIKTAYGEEVLNGWEKEGLWPENMNWAPSKKKIEGNVSDFLGEQHHKLKTLKTGNRVVITSNGILRFMYHAVTGKPPSPEAKVRTGHYCVLSPNAEGWSIEAWDMKP